MKRMLMFVPTLLLLAVPVAAQPWRDHDRQDLVPNLGGTWYVNGNADLPAYVEMRPSGRVLFTNENGSAAWGELHGNRVWIPDWSPGEGVQGLEGRIRGDRIVWPDGHFWSRGAR